MSEDTHVDRSDSTGKSRTNGTSIRSIDLNKLGVLHPCIRCDDWRSPLIHRLIAKHDYEDGKRSISAVYYWKDFDESPVEIQWSALSDDFRRCLNTYQAPVLTEFGALALSCILVHVFPGLEITEVTKRGERADYWLGDREYLLEVSGQVSGNLETLKKDKIDQLLENPFGTSGFVCVVNFGTAKASLTFHRGDL